MEDYKIRLEYVTKGIKSKKNRKVDKDSKDVYWALRGISFDIYRGEFFGIIGMGGSGKSTLSEILAGKAKQTTGFLTMAGHTTIVSYETQLRRDKTAVQNIQDAITDSSIDYKNSDQTLSNVLKFADLGVLKESKIEDYSPDMRARVELAMAFFIEPDIIILDGVLSALDDIFYQKTVDKIKSLQTEGKTFVLASQDLQQMEFLTNRIAWIQNGQLMDIGESENVVMSYLDFVAWYDGLTDEKRTKYDKERDAERKSFNVEALYTQYKETHFDPDMPRSVELRRREAFYNGQAFDNAKYESKKKKKKSHSKLALVLIGILILAVAGTVSAKYIQTNNAKQESILVNSRQRSSSKVKELAIAKSISASDVSKKGADSSKKIASSKAASSSSVKQKNESIARAEAARVSEAAKVSSEEAASSESAKKESSEKKESISKIDTKTVEIGDGDSLSSIATDNDTTSDKLMDINSLSSNLLHIGQKIKVPK
ncbi:ATP-binding cassette domain-containing protein [Dellaglioa algida]|uniref:Peptidoglycan-binding protein LysM n=1 Tax=Dellaglioa algida TaxID=105612 RepID=A0A2C8ENP5_9LACO|nr:ATP-binding cassette domain-containing protein [Dellaglioa algida]MDK1716988.1 ATP-binding cassette domain-containing protein [Dellaglioa algida]MDK1718446.1 ATP-binding cassette domain-containing protein [Dellaglioa algida]MDK1719762.1 ATP-binding cassette domain-containing protein [Dellaglioa algida]MDK1721777.1 ATP-binding cassette domain-containing protein [Dellaglioa algida]MDK1723105.1 ATP-binding cassette domain-containing protein [Dellaglioa algida]